MYQYQINVLEARCLCDIYSSRYLVPAVNAEINSYSERLVYLEHLSTFDPHVGQPGFVQMKVEILNRGIEGVYWTQCTGIREYS